jgi:hypothetical protein
MAYITLTDGVKYDVSDVNSGTGNYDSFLRLQAHGTEEGFNTDDGHEADNKDGIWTHSLPLSDMTTVTVDGVQYYEIRLDLNEGNAAGDPPINLDELRIFYSSGAATGADLDNNFVDLTEVFNLSGSLALNDVHTGSGSDDYVFLIPTSLFPDGSAYFTLYSEFSDADGGFEEWRVLANENGTDGLPAIHLEKTAAPTHINEGTASSVLYTYTVTSQSASTDPLTLTAFIDDNNTPGDTSDDINLLEGVDVTHPLGIHYVSGDTDNDHLLDSTETWVFNYTVNNVLLNSGDTRVNIASVFAQDDEGNTVSDYDDAIVTADDVLPAITLVKDANPTTVTEGTPTNVLYTYTLTSQSPSTDPLTVTSLVDDNATVGTGDDIDLLSGVDVLHPLGQYYVSGDLDNDQLLDSNETWVFNYTRTGVTLNGNQELTNTATVSAHDDEGNIVGDDDDATVTGQDVLPEIGITKTASTTSIQAGAPTLVTFTYHLTNDSTSPLDPLTLTTLVDDNGTPGNTADDINLLEGIDGTHPLGTHYVSGDDGDQLLETGETWVFSANVTMTLNAGETRTNVVTVYATDDEANSVHASDDAAVTAFNLGRTPGFWSNNGSLLWDGNGNTFPKAGGLGIVAAGNDLAYAIHDLDGNGTSENAAGSKAYLMIGDWNKNGVADPDENVLVISRADALSLLNSSQKLQQDGRYTLARDMVASWLNYLGGSYVGVANDPNSAMHYLDEATAWLINTTTNHDHVLTVSELTAGSKVAQSTSPWGQGFDFDGDAVKGENMVPVSGHDIGLGTTLDIMAGSVIHSGLDHYNNFGFV